MPTCASGPTSRQEGMEAAARRMKGLAGSVGRLLLDFALPPRCPGCGDITPEVHLFCTVCWGGLQFLSGGCEGCGVPVLPGEGGRCAGCVDGKGPLTRSRAAVVYGEVPRSIAMRLKYGRKIALARTMATYMKRPLSELTPGALLVPVPLHRWRLWSRGFNQSVLIARALGQEVAPDLIRRTRATPRLKGFNPSERRNIVRGAFALRSGQSVKGRDIILVDDVVTTGATAEACARALRRAGARQVELLAWARVLR